MTNLKKFLPMIALVIVLAAVISPQFAVATNCVPNEELCNPTRFENIQCFFKEVLKIAAEIGGVFVVVGIFYSGFLFVSARGNAEELGKAKRSITYTVIGAALVLGAWAFSVGIANTVNSLLNGNLRIEIPCP